VVQVKFKKLKKSEIIQQAAIDRVDTIIEKFPALSDSKITLTIEMENSPIQAGPDLFSIKLHVYGGKYDAITIEKSDANLYAALADVCDHMLETLNRSSDKSRVKERAHARKILQKSTDEFDHEIER